MEKACGILKDMLRNCKETKQSLGTWWIIEIHQFPSYSFHLHNITTTDEEETYYKK